MAGLSGKSGDLRVGTETPVQVCQITKWTMDPKVNISAFAHNCSGGFKVRVSGTKDATGTIEGKWDPDDPITDTLDVGTEVTLNLHYNTTQKWIVPAVIESLSLSVDMDSGEVDGWTANWGLNGAWTKPTASAFAPTFPPQGDEEGEPDAEERPAVRPMPARRATSSRVQDAPTPKGLEILVAKTVAAAVAEAMQQYGIKPKARRAVRALAA